MFSNFRSKVSSMRRYAVIILLIFLVGCGSSSSPGRESGRASASRSIPTPTLTATVRLSPTLGPTPSPTPGPIPSPTPSPTPTLKSSLNIQSVEGLQCPIRRSQPRAPLPGAYHLILGPSEALVLATDRLTYTADEIQQMRDYLHEIYNNMASITTSYLVSPPPTLRWIQGSGECQLTLEVSNIGTTTVQISSLGVQLTSAAQPNNYQYRSVDVCSIAGVSCPFGPSGAGDCSTYIVSANLDPSASPGTVFAKTPEQGSGDGGPCPEPTLPPNETLYFTLNLFSPGPQQGSVASYIYAVMPVLTVTDGKVSNTFTLPSMAATIAFTDEEQMPCYGLQNEQDTTFTLVTDNVERFFSCLT